jgi:hypothetical protein
MSTRKPFVLRGGTLTTVALAALLIFGNRAAVRAAEGDKVEYTFGRPLLTDEHTYEWYRRTHADAAAARYGVPAADVGDGMDTWHWWVGVDNPGYWRQNTIATSKAPGNLLDVKVDFLRVLNSVPRNKRFELMGLINDPDTVAADKPDQIRPHARSHEGRYAHLGPGHVWLFQRRHRFTAVRQQEVRPPEVVAGKVH